MKNLVKIILISAAIILIIPAISSAQTFPSFPMSFFGNATLNNEKLPVGAKILAFNNNSLKGEIEIKESGVYGYDNPLKQKLIVSKYATGTLVFKFMLADDIEAVAGAENLEYTDGFISGKTIEKNLNFKSNALIISSSSPEVIITENNNSTTTILIQNDAVNPKINLSSLVATTSELTTVTTPCQLDITASTSVGIIAIEIPDNLQISASSSWNGIINAPTIKENPSVTVIPDSGKTATINSVIEIGFDETKLTFDKAVRIEIAGQSGKDVGYSRSGTFTPIAAICGADNRAVADLLPDGTDCKINSGSDLIIWTKHFTKFVTYFQAATPPPAPVPSGGGGGGGGYSDPLIKKEEIIIKKIKLNDIEIPQQENKIEQYSARELQIKNINDDAGIIFLSGKNLEVIKNYTGKNLNDKELTQGMEKYTNKLVDGQNLSVSEKSALNNFIIFGTKTTKILGAGERAGAVNSYKSAFGKLPKTQEEWQDVIKIGNGRWPSEKSQNAEDKAKNEFKKVYLREPNMEQPNDNAAVTVIAYGLRPSERNLNSEKAGIKIFKNIYEYDPESATDWDVVRAIAYSGAVR